MGWGEQLNGCATHIPESTKLERLEATVKQLQALLEKQNLEIKLLGKKVEQLQPKTPRVRLQPALNRSGERG